MTHSWDPEWTPDAPVDVLVSNAALQWVPGHLDLLPRLVEAVADGGWLAVQVPGNMDEPSHVLRRALAAQPPYAQHTQGVAEPTSHDPETYLRPTLAALPEHLRERFTAELGERLREAYPPSPSAGHGVVLPFRRVFVVAHR